jgi:methionyl-tRNA formyltransferase
MNLPESHILFAGSGEFGAPSLERLIARGAKIAAVYTQPDRPAGRGKKLTPTPIAQVAAKHGIEAIRTADLNKESLPPADVMVVIAFGQKIAPHAVDHPRLGSINLHASLLPKYRGAAPIHRALMAGDTVVGNSVIRLAEKMDAGDVLGQSHVTVHLAETTGELHDRLALDGAELIEQVVHDLLAGMHTEMPQDHSLATLAGKLSRADAAIDWSRPAAAIAAHINGLSPWPGCRVKLMYGTEEISRLTLLRAKPVIDKLAIQPGTLDSDGHVHAGTNSEGGGAIEILDIQPEGGRPMPLHSYQHGHRWEPGMHLESLT